MRTQFQIRVRQNKADTANDLLTWIRDNELTTGSKALERVIKPFAAEKKLPLFQVWQAWGLLKEAKRKKPLAGPIWEIVSFVPIELDQAGDLIPCV